MEVDLRERLPVRHSLAAAGARRLDAVGQQEQRLQADFRLATYAPVVASPKTYASGPRNARRRKSFSSRLPPRTESHATSVFECSLRIRIQRCRQSTCLFWILSISPRRQPVSRAPMIRSRISSPVVSLTSGFQM